MVAQRYYSYVYWHFVGSPKDIDWHRVQAPRDIATQGDPKEPEECVQIVKAILEGRHLRGSCTERIAKGIQTDAFCCVTDIPFKDLPSHAPYYGRVAIGFKAEAVQARFLPVLYFPTEQLPQARVGITPNPELAARAAEFDALGTGFYQVAAARMRNLAVANGTAIMAADPQLRTNPLRNYLKITRFSSDPQDTFYREREWRCVGERFDFSPSDVMAVVAPQATLPALREWLTANVDYADTLSLVAWELIESA